MDKVKSISVFKTFSRKELSRFIDFLNSPYFNKGKKYIARFCEELASYHPDYFSEASIKEKVYSKLYPDEKYNDQRFRKLSSELYKLLTDFLAVDSFMKDENEMNANILSQLMERKLGNIFELEVKKSYEDLQKINLRNDYYNKKMYDLIYNEKFFYFQRKRNHALGIYDKEMEFFTKYSLSLIMTKFIERAMEERFFKSREFKMPLFKEIVKYLEENKFLNDPVVRLLYLQLILCTQDNDESFYKLRKLLYKEEKKISKNQIRMIYTILVNYAVERSEKGVIAFQKEILGLNLEIIGKKLTSQYLSGFQFINIVTLLLKFGKAKQLARFIEENSGLLNPEMRQTILDFSFACVRFYEKDFESSLEQLSKINFDHYQLKFQIKNLTLKIYYEQNQFESIFSLTDSYKHIIKRETSIPASIRKTILDFLKILIALSELRSGRKKTDKWILDKEIRSLQPAEKSWLKEKISEL